MRKPLFLKLIFLTMILTLTLTSCAPSPPATDSGEDDKLSVVVTTFPLYDWTLEILGGENENVSLTLLIDSGIDIHSFQPSVEDITKISKCDMLIYVGGESSAWIKDALNAVPSEKRVLIDLLDVLGDKAKEEEIVEGMEHMHIDASSQSEGLREAFEDQDDDHELDEHVWLSLKNAKIFADHISKELGKLNQADAKEYAENANSYISKLESLDKAYENTVKEAKYDTLVFGDRFPFRYLVDDYNLSYFAAFPGCFAETEASFETVIFLASKLDELKLPHIMAVLDSDQGIAKAVLSNTKEGGGEILVLDSMQSVKSSDVSAGYSYITAMERNLEVLKKALN